MLSLLSRTRGASPYSPTAFSPLRFKTVGPVGAVAEGFIAGAAAAAEGESGADFVGRAIGGGDGNATNHVVGAVGRCRDAGLVLGFAIVVSQRFYDEYAARRVLDDSQNQIDQGQVDTR